MSGDAGIPKLLEVSLEARPGRHEFGRFQVHTPFQSRCTRPPVHTQTLKRMPARRPTRRSFTSLMESTTARGRRDATASSPSTSSAQRRDEAEDGVRVGRFEALLSSSTAR